MATYIAFLRAINLGARRKFAKADIVAACEGAGFTDVETYINTGNVRVTTSLRSRAKVETILEKAFADRAGFDVPTVVFTPTELATMAEDAEELEQEGTGTYYLALLKDKPTAAAAAKAEDTDFAGERLVVRGRAAHLLVEQPQGFHSSKLSGTYVEKALGVATTRNVNVIRELARRWP